MKSRVPFLLSAVVLFCSWVTSFLQIGSCFPISAGTWPELRAVDVDLDGRLDLLVLNRDESRLTVFVNDGRGASFSERVSIDTVDAPSSLAVGRLAAHDEFPSVVVYSARSSFATLAFGDRGGRFAFVEKSFPIRDPTPERVLGLDDVDGDGLLDLMSTAPDGSVRIRTPFLDPRGEIVLDAPVRDARAFVLGDFNGDGRMDLALWGTGVSSHLAVYEARADGQFSVATVFDTLPNPGGEPLGWGASDLDRDGRDELLLLSASAEQKLGFLFALESNDGVYEVFRLGADLRIRERSELLVGDLDRDGLPDALVSGRGFEDEDVTWVLRNQGAPGIAFRLAGRMRAAGIAGSLELADLDGDDFLDLALAPPGEDEVEVLFSPWNDAEPVDTCYAQAGPFVAGTTREIIAGEFTGDDRASLLAVGDGSARILSLEPGGLTEISRFDAPAATGGVASGDLDQRGADDFVLADSENGRLVVHLLGDAGSLEETRSLPVGPEPAGVCVDDLDGDGRSDIAAAVAGDGATVVFLQGEGGSFSDARYDVPLAPDLVRAGDVNGDAWMDLVVTGKDSGHAVVLRGTGGGKFGEPVRVSIVRGASGLAAGDLDGDGVDEIAVVSARAGALTIVRSEGDGFRPRFIPLAPGSLPTSLVLEDLDRDGLVEIAIGNSGSTTVTILEPRDDGQLISKPVALTFAPVVEGAVTLTVGDLDRDGWKDLVLAEVGTGRISLYRSSGCGREAAFRRGDTNADGGVNVADAVTTLDHLFGGGGALACPDAADTDDDGRIVLNDAVALLGHLFGAGADPRPPGPVTCGADPTEDSLAVCGGGGCF